jgi:hypothetical protein
MRYVCPLLILLVAIATAFPDEPPKAPNEPKELFRIGFSLDARGEKEFGHMVIRYTLFEDGNASSVREVHNWALQDSHQQKITKAKIDEIQELAKSLPKRKADSTPREFLVALSTFPHAKSDQRLFDRRALPVEIKTILERMGGIRNEIKDAAFVAK